MRQDHNATYRDQLAVFLGLIVLWGSFNQCTYDRPLIYKKDYKVGNNDLLRLNGFYFEWAKPTKYDTTGYIYPIFFYRDGSVIQMGAVKDTFQLRKLIIENPKGIWGIWGNYKITNDTILIETLRPYPTGESFRHKRVIKKGTLKKDKLFFSRETWNNGPTSETNQEVWFLNFNIKPDSTENWIRKKKKFIKANRVWRKIPPQYKTKKYKNVRIVLILT